MRSLVAALLLVLAAAASAAYPEKPIRFIIPSAPGGSPDVLMRILTQQLSLQLNVPLVVENKPGGSYILGTMDIVKASPDGSAMSGWVRSQQKPAFTSWRQAIRSTTRQRRSCFASFAALA